MICADISPLTSQGTWSCGLDAGHDGPHESIAGNLIWDGDNDYTDPEFMAELWADLNEADPLALSPMPILRRMMQ